MLDCMLFIAWFQRLDTAPAGIAAIPTDGRRYWNVLNSIVTRSHAEIKPWQDMLLPPCQPALKLAVRPNVSACSADIAVKLNGKRGMAPYLTTYRCGHDHGANIKGGGAIWPFSCFYYALHFN